MCTRRIVFLAAVALHCSVVETSMCSEEVAFSLPRNSVSAPVCSTRYLQELDSLEERALLDVSRELERLEVFAEAIKQVVFVEQLILNQLGGVGADLRGLAGFLNAMGGDSGKGSAYTSTLRKRTGDLERKLKKLESVERLVKEESAALSGLVTERAWCFSHVLVEHEHHRGIRRCGVLGFDGLGSVLRRLEHFEGLRESLSCARIKSLGLRSLDVEELKGDLANVGLCPEDLESPEGIAGLQKSLLEMIEGDRQLAGGGAKADNIESIRKRYAERLSLRSLSPGDFMRLAESIDEKFEKLESLEKLGERIAHLAKDLRSSAIERLAGPESFGVLDRAEGSGYLFQTEYHYDNEDGCYELKDEQRKRTKMLLSLSRECRERLLQSLALRRYLRTNFFVLRELLEYLWRRTEGGSSKDYACADADVYMSFTKLVKDAANDFERFLGRASKGNVATSRKDHLRYEYPAQRQRENTCKSSMNTVQHLASFNNTENALRKSNRTILAAIPEERSFHETLELLMRSTWDVLDEYIKVESSRHSDLARARESAERDICSLRENLQKLSE